MCGDIRCWSCGPAQGNSQCVSCGQWADEGPCECTPEMIAAAIEKERLAIEDEIRMDDGQRVYVEFWEEGDFPLDAK